MPFGNSNWPEIDGKMQPRWGRSLLGRLPRVAPPSRPWAERWNPFGIQARNFRKALVSPLARIFHSHLDRDVNIPMKRGVSTSSDASLKSHGTQVWKPASRSSACQQQAGKPALRRWDAAVSAEELLRAYSACLQLWHQNPGRCPGLSCGGLSGLVFAPPCWKKTAMDLALTERLRCCDTAGWEACATRVCHGLPVSL